MAATLVLLMGSTPMVTLPFNAPAGIVRETIPSDDVMVPPDAPLGRPGQPVELASIYVQLAASDGSYATGQVYGAMGGGGQP